MIELPTLRSSGKTFAADSWLCGRFEPARVKGGFSQPEPRLKLYTAADDCMSRNFSTIDCRHIKLLTTATCFEKAGGVNYK